MPLTAFYAGSFDPPTNGHLDVIRRAFAMVDTLVIAIGTHPGKTPLFTIEERSAMLEAVARPVAGTMGGDHHLRRRSRAESI